MWFNIIKSEENGTHCNIHWDMHKLLMHLLENANIFRKINKTANISQLLSPSHLANSNSVIRIINSVFVGLDYEVAADRRLLLSVHLNRTSLAEKIINFHIAVII